MVWTRRQFLSRSSLALFGAASTSLAFTGDGDERRDRVPDGSAAAGMVTADTDQAIEHGLSYLSSQQYHAAGFRNDLAGGFGSKQYTGNVAVSSLAALAFMSAGHQPNRGAYGHVVTDALRYVLAQDHDPKYKGFLNHPEGTPFGPMYGHGFGTLFLAEVFGMVQDAALRNKVRDMLHAAVKLIIDSQTAEGGWRYTPGSREADISVTICQIMALRAARNAGIFVPKEGVVDRCVEYVKNCQDRKEGWFRYMTHGGPGEKDAFARTAAGVVALNTAGIYSGPEIERGLAFLLDKRPTRRATLRGDVPDMYYFYGHYYAVQAMWTAGGDYWRKWFPGIRDELLRAQLSDGSWADQVCPEYATAMACIILQMPNNYLPIMQK